MSRTHPSTPIDAIVEAAVEDALRRAGREFTRVLTRAQVSRAISRQIADRVSVRLSGRRRPRGAELTKWVADSRARRVPNFVIQATGLDTKKKIVARYGENAAFEVGKPLPRPRADIRAGEAPNDPRRAGERPADCISIVPSRA